MNKFLVCSDCLMYPGVVYIEGIVLCDSCFTDLFGISYKDVVATKYCQQCETKVPKNHVCDGSTTDAEAFIEQLKIKES